MKTYLHTGFSVVGFGKPYSDDPIFFAVVEDYVGNIARLGALVSDVFLDVEDGRRVLLLRKCPCKRLVVEVTLTQHTSSSCRVNICFKTMILSHRPEFVWMLLVSSSSQSASLLENRRGSLALK